MSSNVKQINIRVGADMHRTLEAIARNEQQSVQQTARLLLEEGIRRRDRTEHVAEDTPGSEIAKLSMAGGAFDWLADEPDIYDDNCGEPI